MKHLKCKVPFLLLILLPFFAIGQNLVPNPSFEEFTECPDSALELDIEGAYPWTSFSGTPDFFHPCDETGMMSSPNSISHGYGVPFHGIGKAGFIAAGWFFSREVVGVELNEPMIVGESYFVSFHLLRTFGGGGHSNCDCAANNLGLKFTTQAYNWSATIPFDNHAHILFEEVLSDSTNWTEVSGWFVADSTYSYLAIGVFFDNENIIIENYNNHEWGYNTYYFLDAVCVSTNPEDCEVFRPVGIEQNTEPFQLTVYPNPASEVIHIVADIMVRSAEVLDVSGRQMKYDLILNKTASFNVSLLAQGLYILRLEFENGNQQNVSFIKH